MSLNKNSRGFTVIELLIVITVSSILIALLATFFTSSYQGYLNLHENALRSNEVSSGLQSVAKVVRGSNAILEATDTSFTAYTYFTPRDDTLSKVNYVYDSGQSALLAKVIPATGTAPDYTYEEADEVTFTIVKNISDQPVFAYLNDDWQETIFAEENLKDIKAIRITLTTTQLGEDRSPITVDTTVSLRNRKTNL
jgi:prepilin-type N-terminal cleavage/methylation domain-containing protein